MPIGSDIGEQGFCHPGDWADFLRTSPDRTGGRPSHPTGLDCPPPPAEDMSGETQRRLSFRGWPLSNPSPEALARAGFFFLDRLDLVECAFCGTQLGCWQAEDDPMEEHRRRCPLCPLVREQENAAAGSGRGRPGSLPSQPAGRDETGRHHVPGSRDVSSALSREAQVGPEVPNMVTEDSRLRTFQHWPEGAHIHPELLASAGLFYTGCEDRVQCFQCGVILGMWEPDDEPWLEHARLSPGCSFVRFLRPTERSSTQCQTSPEPTILAGKIAWPTDPWTGSRSD